MSLTTYLGVMLFVWGGLAALGMRPTSPANRLQLGFRVAATCWSLVLLLQSCGGPQ